MSEVKKDYDKKWFFLTQEGDLGFRYNNQFGNLCEKVFDSKEELSGFVSNSSTSDRFIKFYKKMQAVFEFLNAR